MIFGQIEIKNASIGSAQLHIAILPPEDRVALITKIYQGLNQMVY